MAWEWPAISDLAAALREIQRNADFPSLPAAREEEPSDDEQGECFDIRLQVTPGSWELHTGDASYDTDHRGAWGASCLDAETDCDDLAGDLISQARDTAADMDETANDDEPEEPADHVRPRGVEGA